MNPADAALDALYDARERDPLPDETPPTDEEMQAMYEHYRKQRLPDREPPHE
jgi:hypothetical protein